ncbi:MAG: hypothetical protein RLZZ385_1350 [Pseudomonadota bacterium]|jgi:tRNA threonylcarbamoyladenosine biosynthesis protein TsaB
MVRVLSLDSSSTRCAAAVCDGSHVRVRSAQRPRSHAQDLLGLVEDVLENAHLTLAQLDCLSVLAGPGSFTGLRIAVGVAQGLALAVNKPVVLLSTLEALAWSAQAHSHSTHVLVAMQARDGEVYFASYGKDGGSHLTLWGQERVAPPAALGDMAPRLRGRQWLAAGDGWVDPDPLQQALGVQPTDVLPALEPDMHTVCELAAHRFKLGLWVTAEQAQPHYIKEHMDYRTVQS